ncbi:aspartyl aminopeptidase [Anaeramoeba flamelloides]|uniref:aspartyl aminopeptidase n=1 Tax=Anaeramoeba flamelloides TaxID=1746091 RepID=A0AAV7Y6Y7_9EUKA|nr:aspartyl aminopeptidase [Anaeramoeba flamelloides]
MSKRYSKQFLKFLQRTPTQYHVVCELKKMLLDSGFVELKEKERYSDLLEKGKSYFLTRSGKSIVAFSIGGDFDPKNGFSIISSHTDSPGLRVKPVSKKESQGSAQIAVSTYGGGLWFTWFDRDLTIAGKVLVSQHLIHIKKPILNIPNLAVHLHNNVNRKGFKPNFENNFIPVISTKISSIVLKKLKKKIKTNNKPENGNNNSDLNNNEEEGKDINNLINQDNIKTKENSSNNTNNNNSENIQNETKTNNNPENENNYSKSCRKEEEGKIFDKLTNQNNNEKNENSSNNTNNNNSENIQSETKTNNNLEKENNNSDSNSNEKEKIKDNLTKKDKKKTSNVKKNNKNKKNTSLNNTHHPILLMAISHELNIEQKSIIDFDLSVVPLQSAKIGGFLSDILYSDRLDNLVSVYTSIVSLIEANDTSLKTEKNTRVVVCFDNEEIGSETLSGANSTFLKNILKTITYRFIKNEKKKIQNEIFDISLRNSYLLSADVAHAVHPNYTSYHEKRHQCKINRGIVISNHSKRNTTTELISRYIIQTIANNHKIRTQLSMNKNGKSGGSTLGPKLSTQLGITSSDIGIPIWGMHSIRETAGITDLFNLKKTCVAFYQEYYNILQTIEEID